MQKAAWFLVVALLAVDVALLLQRRRLEAGFRQLEARSADATLKARYADEEEDLLLGSGSAPAVLSRLHADSPAADAVELRLLVSVDDCTTSIEDEVTRLNEMARSGAVKLTGVRGFFVDEDRPEAVGKLIAELSPAPTFAVAVKNVLADLPGATTPLVLVIRSRDGRILDAHKPIPDDLTRRDAFYARWRAALGLR